MYRPSIMQEHSVSSTTSSPHKPKMATLDIRTKDCKKDACNINKEDKDNSKGSCTRRSTNTESRPIRHHKKRTHTCSKASRRRSRSSVRRSSRKPRNRRHYHRSRRSRSMSRHHSSTRTQHHRHHRRRYSSDTESSSSASSHSSSEIRSSSRHSYHTVISAASSSCSKASKVLPARVGKEPINSTHTKSSPLQNIKHEDHASSSSKESTSAISTGLSNIPSSPTINNLVSFLLNAANSTNPPTTPIKDLLGSTLSGLAATSSTSASLVSAASNTRQARRLYIGSIPIGVSSENMVAFFNSELRSRGLCQSIGEPVVCAQVNSERHFAFIELRSVEETTKALTLDGINCLGSTLRIRRPRDYFSPGASPAIQPVGHLNANAVFLTGIPATLSEAELCRLLSSYGTLRSANILKDFLTGLPRGCGFFEFGASESADLACLGLQNHPAGGGKFFAIRADHLLLNSTPTSAPPPPLMPPCDPSAPPSNVLCLANMVSPDEVVSPEDSADVLEDVRSECLLHGAVVSMQMPPVAPGRIFVEFSNATQAHAASLALAGRKYNGRVVSTSFHDPKRYCANDF